MNSPFLSTGQQPQRATCHAATAALIVIGALFLGTAAPAQAPAPSADEARINALVDRYATALLNFDLDAMSAMWSEDVVYADPTAGAEMTGRSTILSELRRGMEGIADLGLAIHTRFVSNGHAVLIYKGSATMVKPEGVGIDVPVRADGVVVLRIDGDRIAAHTDYVDYGAMRRQLTAAMAGKGGED